MRLPKDHKMSTRTVQIGSQVKVFEENFSDVCNETMELLNLTRRQTSDEMRFQWLYGANPDGVAKFWTIRDSESGKMVGFTAALPRRILVSGCTKIAWNCADFSVHPQYRTLGPAIKLRRAARRGVDEGCVDFLYAHPNHRMAAVHRRVGHVPIGKMVRYARFVKATVHLQQRLRNEFLGLLAGCVVDPLLSLVRRETWRRGVHEMKVFNDAQFDDRFDRLFDESAGTADVIGMRDSRYLNWRYAENPLYQTHAITATKGGDLCGYLLFVIQDGVVHIKDLFPATDVSAASDLVSHVLKLARRRNIKSVSCAVLDGSSLLDTLRHFGFLERADCSEMFGYARIDDSIRPTILEKSSWFLTVGDRDV